MHDMVGVDLQAYVWGNHASMDRHLQQATQQMHDGCLACTSGSPVQGKRCRMTLLVPLCTSLFSGALEGLP